MILKVQLPGAKSYAIGDEIWHDCSLADAIQSEAQAIVNSAGADLLAPPDQHERDALRDRIIEDMTAALVTVSDSYRARRRQLLADRQLTVTGRLLAEAY
jgi:hypothetical protein